MKSVLVTVTGEVREIEVSGYDDLSAACGGYIQSLPIREHNAYVNEEGKLMNLPFNRVATAMCEHFGVGLLPGDFIVGNMVICGPIDVEGDDTDIEPEMLKELLEFVV